MTDSALAVDLRDTRATVHGVGRVEIARYALPSVHRIRVRQTRSAKRYLAAVSSACVQVIVWAISARLRMMCARRDKIRARTMAFVDQPRMVPTRVVVASRGRARTAKNVMEIIH